MVDYDLENLEPPILTVEEAIKRSSLFEVPSFIYPKQIGDISKGMAEADHKILSAEVILNSSSLTFLFSIKEKKVFLSSRMPNCRSTK